MTRLLFRALNSPALILLVIVGVAIQSSVFSYGILKYLQPDVCLLALTWCALRRDFTEGGILTVIIANIAELHSSAPRGLFMITFMLLFLLTRAAARIFVIPNLRAYIGVAMVMTVLAKITNMAVLALLDANINPWRDTLMLLTLQAGANGVLGRWAFEKLDRFDWITYKSIRPDQIIEDEYHQLESSLER